MKLRVLVLVVAAFILAVVGAAVAGSVARPVAAQTAVPCTLLSGCYGSGFPSSGTDLATNGGASVSNNALVLTDLNQNEARSAYSTTQIDPSQGFSTKFQYSFIGNGSSAMADGFTFVVQSDSTSAVGCHGGDLGLGNANSCDTTGASTAAVSPSVAVEFDVYSNAGTYDPSDLASCSHIGVVENADLINESGVCSPVAIGTTSASGLTNNVWIDYTPPAANTADSQGTISVYLCSNPCGKPATATLSRPVTLTSVVGSPAYVGFTGATGLYDSIQEINNWTFSYSKPAAPTINGPAYSNLASIPLTLSGGTTAGAQIGVFDSLSCTGTAIADATADGSGNWSATISSATPGSHTYTAAVVDASGAPISPCSSTLSSTNGGSAVVVVDTTAPTSAISFPSAAYTNAYAWFNGCNGSPWTYSFTICGTASDSSGVYAVGVLIQSTGTFQHGNYWDAKDCNWSTQPYWNLATSGNLSTGGSGFGAGGSGLGAGGSGFGAGGSGFGAGGACITSSGGSGFGAGGSGFGAGGSGFGAGGSGFGAGGSGFGAGGSGFGAGGSGFGAGGNSTSVNWDLPTGLPADGQYQITSQAVDAADNFEAFNSSCTASVGNCVVTDVDTYAPSSTISFPANGGADNATSWQTGCDGTADPWHVTYSICGYATDTNGVDPSGVAAVGVAIQDTNPTNSGDAHAGEYWDAKDCTWNSSPYWNLATLPSGYAGSGFGAGGSGFGAGGSGFGAGGNCLNGNGGSGFGAGGSGFGAGGSGFGAGGNGLPQGVPWYLPVSLPADGTYQITTQAVDNALNYEGGTCAPTAGCSSATRVETLRPTATISVNGQTASGATDIDPNSIIHILFSEPMSQSSLANIQLSPGLTSGATFSANCGSDTLCESVDLNTAATLSPGTVYTLTLDGGPSGCSCVTDQAGDVLDPDGKGSNASQIFTFTTGLGSLTAAQAQDSDGDGIPDAWDGTSFAGPNNTTINTGAWGFSPSSKDLCVVEDWMSGSAADGNSYDQHISQQANQDIVNAFKAQGIHLVIFEGPYSAGLPSGFSDPGYGQAISMVDPLGLTNSDGSYNWDAFMQLRTTYFVPTGLAQLCHFVIAAHTLGGSSSNGVVSVNPSTGSSQGFGGSDFVVAMGTAPADAASGTPAGIGTEIQQAGTVMHELGHNLGLHHGGGDDTNYKPNYLSVMNYFYQFTGLIHNGVAGDLDYSEGTLPGTDLVGTVGFLDEGHLNEALGLGAGALGYGVKYKCGGTTTTVLNADGPVDWNCNGVIDTGTVTSDLDNGGSTSATLSGYNDWAHLQFAGDGTIGFGEAQGTPPGGLPPLVSTSSIDTGTTTSGAPNQNTVSSVQSANITITSPTAGPYVPYQPVTAKYTCQSTVAPIQSCAGQQTLNGNTVSVATGGSVSLPSVGNFPFTVNAADSKGNQSQASVTYNVTTYGWNGFFSPVSSYTSTNTTINAGKAGRTYPLKFQLMDANGNYVSWLTAVKSITYAGSSLCSGSSTTTTETTTTSTAGLHYDSTANQYVYNWQTPSTTGCYMLSVTLADNTTHQALFSLR